MQQRKGNKLRLEKRLYLLLIDKGLKGELGMQGLVTRNEINSGNKEFLIPNPHLYFGGYLGRSW